jgi:hypothetical protein
MIHRITQFAGFWYDFVVGDDWTVAAGVVIALALACTLTEGAVANWWLLPTALIVVLPLSLWRAARRL